MSDLTKDEKLSERESIIRWDAHKDTVSLYTASPAVDRKIRKAGHTPTRETTRKGAWSGSFFTIPYKALSWTVRIRQAPKTRGTGHRFQPKSGSGETV